jgi:hypothetical protein
VLASLLTYEFRVRSDSQDVIVAQRVHPPPG